MLLKAGNHKRWRQFVFFALKRPPAARWLTDSSRQVINGGCWSTLSS